MKDAIVPFPPARGIETPAALGTSLIPASWAARSKSVSKFVVRRRGRPSAFLESRRRESDPERAPRGQQAIPQPQPSRATASLVCVFAVLGNAARGRIPCAQWHLFLPVRRRVFLPACRKHVLSEA